MRAEPRSGSFAAVDARLEAGLDSSLAELSRLVAQPSVAAQNRGMRECAELVLGYVREHPRLVRFYRRAFAPDAFCEVSTAT